MASCARRVGGPLLKPREHGRMLNPLPLACRLEGIIRVCTDLWPRIARLAARTLPTLNRLGALMGLPILRRCGSS